VISSYNVDERIISGLDTLFKAKINTIVAEHNAEFTDGITMKEFIADNIYDDFISVDQILGNLYRFPAICFYIEDTIEEERNNAIYFNTPRLRIAVFTDESNGGTLIKRYLVAIRELINANYKDIDPCVFNITGQRWRYFAPARYGEETLRIAELDVQVITEVRR
jgi:hypothetical protein